MAERHQRPGPGAGIEHTNVFKRLAHRASSVPQLQELLEVLGRRGAGRTLAVGAAKSLAISVVGTLLSFPLQIALANAIGIASYGVYVYTLAWLNVAVIIGRFDLDIVLTRFTGAYAAREQWSALRGLVRRTRQIAFGFSLGISLIAALVLFASRGRLTPEMYYSALLAAALLPVSALLLLTGGTLQGLKDVVGAQMPYLVIRPLAFLTALAVAQAAVSRSLNAVDAMALNLAATLIPLAVASVRLHRRMPGETRSTAPQYETSQWLHAAGWLVLIDLFQLTISQQSDVLIVGSLIGQSAVGQYGAASQVAAVVHFAVTAVIFIITPAIAALFAQQRIETLRRLIRSVVTISMLVSAPVVLLLVLGGRQLLGLYGEGFAGGYATLLVLCVNQFVAASVGTLAGTIMTMTGQQREAARIIGASALLNLLLSLLLTPRFGLVGAASATLTATVVRSLFLTRYLRRELGLLLLPTRRIAG